MDEQRLLSVRDLKTHFLGDEGTTRAVDGVSFDLLSGRTLGVVGETGCGKSVTARSILRIVDKPGRIVGGEILLRKGEDWLDLAKLNPDGPEIRAIRGGDIGLVFQEPMAAFSPVHTVGNQLMEAVRLHCQFPKQEMKQQVRSHAVELLDKVGVPRAEERLAAYPWQLSGGLLQRCMIAMAMAGSPRILIADEPTTALDVITQAHILDLIREIQERTKLSIMLITHDLSVVAQMADEVAVMYLGRVVEHGPVDEIFEAPKHPYTRALLQSIPSRHKTARVQLPTIAGSIPNPFNRPAGCTFHPRCTQAIAGVCEGSEPNSHALSDRHRVACHAYNNGAGSPLLTISAEPVPANGHSVGRAAPAASEPVLLQVNHLRKEYAVQGRRLGRSRGSLTAVDDVTFEVRTAETLALVGESGSGKTTTSRCILRAIAPESGDILFRTKAGDVVNLATLPAKGMRPLRPEIQMIFQDPYSSLNPRMTILDLIGEPLLVNGVKSRQERADRVEELLRLVGLRAEFMRRFPHAFSGGQRQRIGIARALALNPRLVVADEPVSALDVSVQAQTLNLLMELQDRLDLTYLFVAHDLSVVRHISDRTGVMYAGQLVELGETRAILEEPKHPYTAALLAAIPKPDPRARAMFNIPRAKGDPGALLKGCQFQRRCQFATKLCEIEKPAWQEVEPGRYVRCHRVQEIQLRPLVTSKNGRAERSPLPG